MYLIYVQVSFISMLKKSMYLCLGLQVPRLRTPIYLCLGLNVSLFRNLIYLISMYRTPIYLCLLLFTPMYLCLRLKCTYVKTSVSIFTTLMYPCLEHLGIYVQGSYMYLCLRLLCIYLQDSNVSMIRTPMYLCLGLLWSRTRFCRRRRTSWLFRTLILL